MGYSHVSGEEGSMARPRGKRRVGGRRWTRYHCKLTINELALIKEPPVARNICPANPFTDNGNFVLSPLQFSTMHNDDCAATIRAYNCESTIVHGVLTNTWRNSFALSLLD